MENANPPEVNLPPHGKSPFPQKFKWEVTIPYGSELIRRVVTSDSADKAFKRVVMDMSRELNKPASILFRKINAEKQYKVEKVLSSFVSRAGSVANVSLDLERIKRLPLVYSAILYESVKNNVALYRAYLEHGNTLDEVRELTGQIQTLFGARLLSSGVTEEVTQGIHHSVVEVRVSLLSLA